MINPGDRVTYAIVDEISYEAIYLGEHDGRPWLIYPFSGEDSAQALDNGEPPTMPFAARWSDIVEVSA